MEILNQNILIIDDHLVVRKGVELIIKDKFTNPQIFEAENYNDAIEIVSTIKIDLIILDIIINGKEDINIMKEFKKIQNHVKILVLSCHEEEFYGLRYLKNGADGYLQKFSSEDNINLAISKVLKTGFYHSESLQKKIANIKANKGLSNPIDSLSNREFEIAKMLVNGSGNLEIANLLNIQMSTVSTYKNRIFEKLNINNIVALSEFLKFKNN